MAHGQDITKNVNARYIASLLVTLEIAGNNIATSIANIKTIGV